MATMRLVPSTYSLSSNTYLSVSNANNMYDNTDSSTYATVTNSQTGTTSYYIYIKGFNFNDLPSNAIVNSFSIKLRVRESGITTSTSYGPKLCNNTAQITSSCSMPSTTVQTLTFSGYSLDWEDLVAYGTNFGIRLNCRRASRNTTGYMYIYGAEIEVDYTVPIQHSVIVNNSTSATVLVSDTAPYEGEDVIVSINTLSGITVTDNGINVTNQFVREEDGSFTQVASEGLDTEFSDTGGAFYISSSSSTAAYLEYAIGHTAENPGTETSTNTYVKGNASGNTTTGTAIYSFDFSEIPPGATITGVTVKCYAARENATIDSTHVCRMAVYSGTTLKGAEQNLTSTSYSIVTLSNPGTWTWDELQEAKFHFTLGYYGGRIAGISWTVTYEAEGYAYTITSIAADHTIVVTSSGGGSVIYQKVNGAWRQIGTLYQKVNGTWTSVPEANYASVLSAIQNLMWGDQ